jgi:hypothetical protein
MHRRRVLNMLLNCACECEEDREAPVPRQNPRREWRMRAPRGSRVTPSHARDGPALRARAFPTHPAPTRGSALAREARHDGHKGAKPPAGVTCSTPVGMSSRGMPYPAYRVTSPSLTSCLHCAASSDAKPASSMSTPASMFRVCPRSVKFADVISDRSSSTTMHFA